VHLLAVANGVIGGYAMLEQYVYIFPFTGGLRAEAAEIADGKEHVLEVRLEKTLHKEFLPATGGVEGHGDNFSFFVSIYSLAGGVVEEILKGFEASLFEDLCPVFCKFNLYHSQEPSLVYNNDIPLFITVRYLKILTHNK